MQDGVHSSTAGASARSWWTPTPAAGTAFADLLSAMEALPEAFLAGKSCIIGSAEALPILCVRYFWWERERDRRKWRHHCRAKIGDEFTLSLAKNSHNWRWDYTFPCQKFALFVSPFTLPVSLFTERSPWWRWNSQWVHTFHCQKCFRPQALFPLFQTSRATSDRKPKTNDQILPSPILFFPSKNWIKLIPKLLEIEKEIVREVGRVINLTWENLQIAKHKSGRRSFSFADWFVLCDL